MIVAFVFMACEHSVIKEERIEIQVTKNFSPELLAKLDLGLREKRVFIMQNMHNTAQIAILEISEIGSYNNQEEYKIALFTPEYTSTLPIGFTIPVAQQDANLLLAKLSDEKVRLELDSNGMLELEFFDDKHKHNLFSQFSFPVEVDFMSAQIQYFIAKRKCGKERECLKFVVSCEEFEACYSNRALVTLPFIPLTHNANVDFVIRNINKQIYRFLEHSSAQQDLFYAQDLPMQRQQIRDYLKERLGVRRMLDRVMTFKMPHSDFLGTSRVDYMDSKILGFVMNMYFYEGDEQYNFTYPMVFDLQSGAQLATERLENLFYAGARDWEKEVFRSVEFQTLLEKYRAKESAQCLPQYEDKLLPPDNFFIRHSGVVFTYNTKGLVPNGCGIIEVLVPLKELREFVEQSSSYAYLFGI